jgi:hypothetical protein
MSREKHSTGEREQLCTCLVQKKEGKEEMETVDSKKERKMMNIPWEGETHV